MAKKVTRTATTEHTKQFVKCMDDLCYRHNAFTVFSDFLAMAAIGISNAVNFNDDREQEYLRIVNKYNENERALFPQMLGCIVNELQPAEGETPRYRDVLGELFHCLNLQNEWKAQFFTPQCVADFMALCTIGDFEERINRRGYVTMLEPCIGGGATVIGAVNAMFQKGYNPCKQLLVTGYDLDPRCIHMSYIQLSLMGVPAMIQQRNSLSEQTYGDYWFTPIFILDDWSGRIQLERAVDAVRKIFAETETAAEIETPPEVKPVETPAKAVQLSLF